MSSPVPDGPPSKQPNPSLEQRPVVAHSGASIIDKDQGLSTTCQDGTAGSQGSDKEYLTLY